MLVLIADSSLGNNARYSQGGYVILLCAKDVNYIAGKCSLITFKSGKSKRVASSTLHAETLALVSACEEGQLVQSFWHELQNPGMSAAQLINVPPDQMLHIRALTDCRDLLDTLISATPPVLSNKSQLLFTSYLREVNAEWLWIDTRENPANCLTKLEGNGRIDFAPLSELIRTGAFEPRYPFRNASGLRDPSELFRTEFPAPPPPTSEMRAKVGEKKL